MSLETYTGYIPALVDTNPTPTDPKSEGDDHIRGIKETLSTTFAGFTETNVGITVTASNINAVATGGILNVWQPGMVMAFAFSTTPIGWLQCNGQQQSRTQFAALFAAIGTTFGAGDGSTTFNLPDLRGQFIRGWSATNNPDTGRVFGSSQSSTNQAHTHTGTTADDTHTHTLQNAGLHAHTTTSGQVGGNNVEGGSGRNEVVSGNATSSLAGDHTHIANNDTHNHTFTTASSGGESRPINVALQYCIKF